MTGNGPTAGPAEQPTLITSWSDYQRQFGSLIWNGLLVGAGALLGRRYEVVEQYANVVNYVVVAAVVLVVGWFVVRRLRRRTTV